MRHNRLLTFSAHSREHDEEATPMLTGEDVHQYQLPDHAGLECVPVEMMLESDVGVSDKQYISTDDKEVVDGPSGISDGAYLEEAVQEVVVPKGAFRFRSRSSWAVTIVLIFVIVVAVVVASVAASGVQWRNTANAQNTGASSHPRQYLRLHSQSKLAASNWTDHAGTKHKVVYFQDEHRALIARRWDSQNQTWTTSNITAALGGTALLPLPAPGTSLAAAAAAAAITTTTTTTTTSSTNSSHGSVSGQRATSFENWLMYLDEQHIIHCVGVADAAANPSAWVPNAEAAPLQAGNSSKLSLALQHRACDDENNLNDDGDCSGGRPEGGGFWLTAYQRPDGSVTVANKTDEVPWIQRGEAAAFTPLAMTTAGSSVLSSSSSSSPPPVVAMVWQKTETTMYELGYPGLGGSEEEEAEGKTDRLLYDTLEPPSAGSVHSFAGTRWWRGGDGGITAQEQALWLALRSDGTATAQWFDGEMDRTYWAVVFDGLEGGEDEEEKAPPLWSAVAMDLDATFFGISEGRVLEFEMDKAEPARMDFRSVVFESSG